MNPERLQSLFAAALATVAEPGACLDFSAVLEDGRSIRLTVGEPAEVGSIVEHTAKSKSNGSTLKTIPPAIKLSLSERKLIRVCLDQRQTGKQAIAAARVDYTGYWRGVLAGLARKGMLEKDPDGYLATAAGRAAVAATPTV